MMALAGVGLETLVFEPDALTTRPPPCATCVYLTNLKSSPVYQAKRRQKHLQLDQFTVSQQKPSPRQKQLSLIFGCFSGQSTGVRTPPALAQLAIAGEARVVEAQLWGPLCSTLKISF